MVKPWAEKQIQDALKADGKFIQPSQPKPATGQGKAVKPPKYRNQPCESDGDKFDSKLERRVYERLVAQHGKRNVIRQVSIPIGKRRIRPDFMIIHERFDDGTFRCEVLDAKGHVTQAWEARSNHLEDAYGINVKLMMK